LYSKGRYILFADADGATDINSLETVLKECQGVAKNGRGCTIGSRKEDNAVVERKGLRKFLAWGMKTIVQFILKNNIKDTQCGFKMFSRDAARLVFPT
jgi:dolichyl-phosphate beta-glucosyltransferase